MKFIFTLTISLAFFFCSCSSSENTTDNLKDNTTYNTDDRQLDKTIDNIADTTTDNQVEVRIEVTDSLYLSVYENGQPMLNGKVKVTLINYSDLPVRLDPLNIHRLRFTEKSTQEVFNVIHECDCFNQHYARIAAGDTVVNNWNGWVHEGGPFTPPAPGEYLLSFGVDDFSRSKIDRDIKNKFSRNRREAIKLCKEKFAAIKSNTYESEQISINLKQVQ